ncbi:hypothetical protein DPMN_110784 [Dreissena polymorpha]|uniref:Uncharacterized protein n=1 Tax=Dreissena polymorpha TaxID=45954 RepID=A0A9D4KCM8_DREPO|nr:hypothetical protein DPMN_110784 [Dreissena polymorpha]
MSKPLYMDGTTKVCNSPITQLCSMHSFAKDEYVIKQLQLCFQLKTRRKRRGTGSIQTPAELRQRPGGATVNAVRVPV